MNQESGPEAGDESTADRPLAVGRQTPLSLNAAVLLSVGYLVLLVLGGIAILYALSRFGLLPRESPYTAAREGDLGRGLLSYSLLTLWGLLLVHPLVVWGRRFGGTALHGVPGFAMEPKLMLLTLQGGLAGLGAVVAGAVLAGARPVSGFQAVDPGSWLGLLLFLVVAAALEEVVFRGFLLRVWVRAAGTGVSLAMTSLIFALLHSGNPSAAPLAVFNTVLAGFVLGLLVVRSGSLWPALSLHFMWNAAQGPLLGLPVSGLRAGFAILPVSPGTGILAGGSYGFEGGLGATVVLSLGCALLVGRGRILSPSASDRATTSDR